MLPGIFRSWSAKEASLLDSEPTWDVGAVPLKGQIQTCFKRWFGVSKAVSFSRVFAELLGSRACSLSDLPTLEVIWISSPGRHPPGVLNLAFGLTSHLCF